MSHYRSHYPDLRFPIATAHGQVGLRKAQLGALWAVGSHFTVHREPALVVMPTGSGKTAVVTLVPFLLQAERVLVITSNQPVRHQIATEFQTQRTLTNLGVVKDVTAPGPKVKEVSSRVLTPDAWESLKDFDVVIGLPGSISPALPGVATPPSDLFDVVLVDEAHHQPAQTWNAILSAFPNSRRALFTATPTRRDRKEIDATIVYAYSVAAAKADGFFGTMRFVPVHPQGGEKHDVAVARAAEDQVRADRAAGLKHYLLVRTDSKARADELLAIYRQTTPQLRLEAVHSGRSYKAIRKTLDKLDTDQLDGVVCVDMMSEGFDLPRLKIAAIHSPHRSLEVTLQFVGRFARTNDGSIGGASFIGVPAELSDEVGRLYADSAVWDSLIPDLSQARFEREQQNRAVVAGFRASDTSTPLPTPATSVPLYTLRPQFHAMVVECEVDVDITAKVTLPPQFTIERYEVNEAARTVVIIANERERPRWTTTDSLSRSEYELFVGYFDRPSRMLFMCTSRHTPDIYDHFAASFTRGAHRPLATYQLNRVLNGLEHGRFFSVGMRSRIVGDRIESYRILAGSSAEKAILKSDGRYYSRGHVMGRGQRDGQAEVIGYSSGSKVWSTKTEQLSVLLKWCQALASRMLDETAASPDVGGLEHLSVGERAVLLPPVVTFVDWTEDVYRDPLPELVTSDGTRLPLGDIDLVPLARAADGKSIDIELQAPLPDAPRVTFDLEGWPYFSAANAAATACQVRYARESSGLIAYLNSMLLDIYGPDLSRIRGREVFKAHAGAFEPFERDRITSGDWTNTNIECECNAPPDGRQTVQDAIRALLQGQHGVVVFDHRSGEVADFVHVRRRAPHGIVFMLYHCKGSGGPQAGSRVEDAYEVCGQVLRSVRWVGNERGLIGQLLKRLTTGSQLVLGSEDDLRGMKAELAETTAELNVCIVQPGFSRARVDASLLEVLAATEDYVRRARSTLHILGSD